MDRCPQSEGLSGYHQSFYAPATACLGRKNEQRVVAPLSWSPSWLWSEPLPLPLLPGLHSSPMLPACPRPTSGLPTSEPTRWPHLLDLLGAQLGDVENLLCLLQAEAREIGGSCRLVSGTSPGVSCCPAGCVDMPISAQPSAAESSPRPSMWVAQRVRWHGRRDT